MTRVPSGPAPQPSGAAAPGTEPAAAVYRLPAARPGPMNELPATRPEGAELLRQNVAWFCRLRWIVVATLIAAGCAAFVLAPTRTCPWLTPGWPLVVAVALAASNAVYLMLLARTAPGALSVRVQFRAQIVVDLLLLTLVVHHVGSTSTHAPLLYSFHIIIACMFLSNQEALTVTAVATALYLACVTAEQAGLWPVPTAPVNSIASALVLQAGSLVVIWLVTWYLVSRLADSLHRRERELAATNHRLEASGVERMRHMLQTTHELKAPFAAIHAQTQVLLEGYCGPLPGEARRVVQHIADRCAALSQQIRDMLQLANLRSEAQGLSQRQEIDVATLIESCVARIAPAAALRSVTIETDVTPTPFPGVEDHLRMLLDNLLANAVNYSRDGSKVTVQAVRLPGGSVSVVVADEGIGIPADKLPRIFDDYYRTKEAVKHNPSSTGLGLAIVRDVAGAHGIEIGVTSVPGRGTRFVLTFPSCGAAIAVPTVPGGVTHGVSHDR